MRERSTERKLYICVCVCVRERETGREREREIQVDMGERMLSIFKMFIDHSQLRVDWVYFQVFETCANFEHYIYIYIYIYMCVCVCVCVCVNSMNNSVNDTISILCVWPSFKCNINIYISSATTRVEDEILFLIVCSRADKCPHRFELISDIRSHACSYMTVYLQFIYMLI